MSVALAAEPQYGNIAALDQGQVGVIVVKHLCRHLVISLGVCSVVKLAHNGASCVGGP
jgi:hypothetical protein